MGRGKEQGTFTEQEVGKGALAVSIYVARNVLNAVDQGATTDQIRESLMRIESGKPVEKIDARLILLGIWQKPTLGKIPQPLFFDFQNSVMIGMNG